MEFVEFSPDLSQDWDSVVYRSPDGWAFCLSRWLDMVARVWGMENLSFVVRENSKIVAVCPLHWISAEKRLSSGGWGYGGPIIASHVSAADRRRLFRACWKQVGAIAAERGADRITASLTALSQSSLQNRWGVNPLVEAGLTDTSTHTRIVNLDNDEDKLWLELAKDARQKIKQARAAGYTVRRCTWKEMLDDYYRVHSENYIRTGVRPHPKSYFEGIANQPAEHHVLWVGFDPLGSPVAFHNDARFGKTAVYHTGCAETGHLVSGINYLLFWEAMLGEKRDGVSWYETGETFPQALTGKEKGLSDFKAKFGGELHRSFRGERGREHPALAEPVAPPMIVESSHPGFRHALYVWLAASRDLMQYVLGRRLTRILQTMFFKLLHFLTGKKRVTNPLAEDQSQIQHSAADNSRQLFSREDIYKAETISQPVPTDPEAYPEILLQRCIQLARAHATNARVLDVCCANGHHLIDFSEIVKSGTGIDFSVPYIQKAVENKTARRVQNLDFICNDAARMSLCTGYFDLAYSFSSLYIIPDVANVVHEVARVLRPGGTCVLDLGNRYSLNALVANTYHRELGWARIFPVSVPQMKQTLRSAGLRIVEHHSFQLLPLWAAARPTWLVPFLLPVWTRLLKKKIKGRMLDEWISSLPVVRLFAFRHIFVCEKE